MNLLQMLNNVLTQSGFLEKGSFTNGVDPDDKQMVAIANRAAYEIFNYYKWPALRNTYTFTFNEGQSVYRLPDDYQDMMPNSAWELEGQRPVDFPVSDNQWFLYKFTDWGDGGTVRAKIYGKQIEVIQPVGSNGFTFEYISKWPIVAADGSRKEFFTADTDTWSLDDQLLILGTQAHWQQTKQMPSYQELFGNYRLKMSEAIGRAAGSKTIGGFSGGSSFWNTRGPYTPLWKHH
jgi:hypothetical protein